MNTIIRSLGSFLFIPFQCSSHLRSDPVSEAWFWGDISARCILQCWCCHRWHVYQHAASSSILSYWHPPKHGNGTQCCHTFWPGPRDYIILKSEYLKVKSRNFRALSFKHILILYETAFFSTYQLFITKIVASLLAHIRKGYLFF